MLGVYGYVPLCLYYCLPMGLKMYNNKLHIELAVRLIDRLIYVYICVLCIYNSLAKLLGDRLKQHLSKKLTKATKFTFCPIYRVKTCVCIVKSNRKV